MLYKSPHTRLDVSCLLTTTSPLCLSPPIASRGLPELPPILDTDGVQVPSARTLPGEWLTAIIDLYAVYYARPCNCGRRHRPLALSSSAGHRRLARASPSCLIADLLRHSLTIRGVLILSFRDSVFAARFNDGKKSVAATRADGEEPTRTNGRKKKVLQESTPGSHKSHATPTGRVGRY